MLIRVPFIRLPLLSFFTIAFVFAFVSVSRVQAGEVRVGIGYALAPYVLPEQDGGVEVDLIREAFKRAGHKAVFVYLPNLRLPLAFSAGEVDCIAVNTAYDVGKDSGQAAFDSDTTVTYQNFAISQASSGYTITSIKDLSDKVVLGFNNAVKYLGPEYAAMAAANPNYSELADQSLQVRMLYTGRVRVIVSEKRIFLYWRKWMMESTLADVLSLDQELVYSPIFSPAPRNVVFRTPDLIDGFNKGLEAVKQDGTFDAIVEKYVGAEGR